MTAQRKQVATVVTFPKSPEPANSPNILPSLRQVAIEILTALKGLSFGSLSDGERAGHHDMVSHTFLTPGTANTEFTVYHALGRRPNGRLVASQDFRGTLWDVKKKWTPEKVVFLCDRANQEFTVLLF